MTRWLRMQSRSMLPQLRAISGLSYLRQAGMAACSLRIICYGLRGAHPHCQGPSSQCQASGKEDFACSHTPLANINRRSGVMHVHIKPVEQNAPSCLHCSIITTHMTHQLV